MRVSPIFNTTKTYPYIAQLATGPFIWGWDFNHWVPWMLHYPLRPPKKTHHMIQLELKNPPDSMRRSITSANRFRIFYRSLIPSTSSVMINTVCHTSFRWETKFGCTCKNNALQDPIERFVHFAMDLTPSPRLWVTIILSSTSPPSLVCTQCLI